MGSAAQPLTADWSTAVPITTAKPQSGLTADWSTAVPISASAAAGGDAHRTADPEVGATMPGGTPIQSPWEMYSKPSPRPTAPLPTLMPAPPAPRPKPVSTWNPAQAAQDEFNKQGPDAGAAGYVLPTDKPAPVPVFPPMNLQEFGPTKPFEPLPAPVDRHIVPVGSNEFELPGPHAPRVAMKPLPTGVLADLGVMAGGLDAPPGSALSNASIAHAMSPESQEEIDARAQARKDAENWGMYPGDVHGRQRAEKPLLPVVMNKLDTLDRKIAGPELSDDEIKQIYKGQGVELQTKEDIDKAKERHTADPLRIVLDMYKDAAPEKLAEIKDRGMSISNFMRGTMGAGREIADSLSSPSNLAIMGALSIKGTPKLVQVIANGKFSYDQAKAALEGFQRGYEAYKNGDALTATKEWTAAPVNAFFAVMTGKHAVEGGLDLRKTAVPAIKQTAGDVRDALNQAHESVMRSGEPRNDSPYAIVGHDAETGLPIMRRKAPGRAATDQSWQSAHVLDTTAAPEASIPAEIREPRDQGTKGPGEDVHATVSQETGATPGQPVAGVAPPIGAVEPETGRPVLQASPRPEVNQAAATAEHPEIKDAIAKAIRPVNGAKISGARAEKDAGRRDEKIEEGGQSPRTVRDYSGYRIAVDSFAARDQVLAALRGIFEVHGEQDHFEDGDPEHGFHAYTLNVREPGSPVSHEVQILPREVAVTADTRHGVYERAREGDPKAAAELKAANAADWQRFQARQTPVAQGARLQGVDGKKTVLHGVGDSVRPATYRLVEADDLMPSHNAFTFEENPGFEKGEQERDYKNSKEAQSRVLNQSGANFEPRYMVTDNPDAVNGPPVIYPNGKVPGGNSRAMTILRVYADGRGDVYRDALRQDAAHYGYTPENVDAMRQPVLVREIDYPANLDESQRLGSELNKSKTGALGGSEQAVSAGAKLRPETLNTVANWLAEDDSTLRELLRKRGLPILQMLVEDGALTDQERPGYLDHGALNDKGKYFIEQALLGHVVNDARLLDVAPKSILDKIEKSMGSISSIGARPDEWNLIRAVRPALLRAVAEHTTSAANGVPIELTLEQQALFGPGRNQVVDALVRVLNEKPTVVRDKFKAFAQDAGQNQPGQFSLLPGQEAFDAFNHAFGSTLTDEEFRNGIDELFTRPAAAETAAAKSQPSADTRQGEALPGESGRDGQRPSIPSTGGAAQPVERAGAVSGGDTGVVERFRAGMEAQKSGVRGQGSEKLAAEPKYKFASTQHNIAPDSEAGRALDAARERVAEADLAGDGKNIDGNHVTVRYGLKGDLTPAVQSFIEGLSPFDATLGAIEAFKPSEHSDGAAPLIAPVNSSELARINQEIAKHGEFTEPSFAEYKPHATVAYVKPEAAEKYVGDKSTAGKKFRVDSIAVTDRNGNQTEIQLKGKAIGAGGDVRGPADREVGATGPDDRGFPKGTRVRLADGREGVVEHPPYAFNGGLPRARVRLDAVGDRPSEMLMSVKPEEMERQGPGDQGTKGPSAGGDARATADREVGATKPVQQGQAPAGERKPVGEPLPARIQQIKEIAATGQKVVIFSAEADNPALHEVLRAVGLGDLPVTNIKGNDFGTLVDNQVDEPSNVNQPMQIPPIPKGKALYVDFDGTLFKQQGSAEARLPENQGRAVLQDSPEQTMLGNPREQGAAGTAGPLTPLRSAQDDIVSEMERERAEQAERKAKRDNDHTMANGVGLTENAARHQTKVEEQAGRKAVVLDAHGEGVWHRLFAGSSDLGSGEKWYGMRLAASGVKKALIKLGKAIADKENTPEARDGYARMAKAIRDAQQPDGGASILRGDYHADTAREEAWHNWQFEHNFHESYALASVADQPEFADAMERLRGMGYRDLEKRMLAMEAMAKALGGDREFHISDEQREDLVRAFLSEALDEKGAEILQNMPHVDPRVRGIVEELRRNHAQESIQENRRGAEPAARGGSGADSGRGSNGRGEGLYADPANFRERADAGVERGVSKDGAEGELNKGQGSGVRDQDLLFQRFRAGLDRRKGVESHALPGMEGDVEAQRTAAAEDQGRQLTERMREPGRNISRKAGEMERESPLFRDTDASGMGTLFGERGSGGADSSIKDEMREWKRSEEGQLRSYPTVEAWKAARDAKLKKVMAAAKARDDAAAADAAKNKQPVPDAAAMEARREVERAAEKARWKEEFETRAANKKAQQLRELNPMPLWKEAMGAFKDWRDDKPTAGMEFREMAREKQGQMDREVLQKKKELEEDRKRFVTMPHEDVTELIDQIQHGRYDQMKPEYRKIFEPLGEMWEQTRARMQALKPELLQNYYEHYFPQLWARPGRVARLLSGKRSLFSPNGFLKSRTIPTFREGIEYGLEPKTWNPLDTVLMQYAAERKYLRDLEMVDDMRRHGMLRAFKSEKDAPEGWEKLDDRFATVTRRATVIDEQKVVDATYDKTYAKGASMPSDEGPGDQGTEGQGRAIPSIATEDLRKASRPMTVIEGYYFAPKQIARSFNNMVSKGLHGRMGAIDAAFDINKSMNAVQLGMSAFHATASTINLAIGDIALGLEQGGQALDAGIQGLNALKSGDMADVRARFGEALRRGASAAGHAVRGATVLGPVARHLWVGDRVIAEYLKPGAAAKYAAEANWIARAGARPEQALNLQPEKWRQVVEDIRRGDWFKGAQGAIPGTIDLAGSWLMRGMIPRIKYGAMQDMAHSILAEAARRDWSDEETRRRMQDAWDSIDNRYGQMVYDNKFWNRTALELAQLGIRSVGWQGGTYMEYGGAVGDTMKAAARVAAGKRPELTHKMAFALATPIFTGAFAAAATYLLTGHKADTEKYGLKAYGMVEMPDGTMLSIPGYSKNLMSLGEDIRQNTVPYRTAINTASPFLSSTLEMMQNKDYYVNQIRNEDDPVIAKDLGKSQAGEYAKFVASQFIPFTLKSFLEQRSQAGAGEFAEIGKGQSGGQAALSYLGFQPATRVMTNSPAMNLAQHYHEETPTAERTAEQAARSKTLHNLIHTLEQGHMVTLEEAEARGVTREQYHRVLNELHYTPLARAVSGLKTFEQAREVWQKATPEERAGLQEVMEKKARKEVETVYHESGDAAADEFEAKLKEQGITQ